MCNNRWLVVKNFAKFGIVQDTFFDFVYRRGASLQGLANLTHGIPLAELECSSQHFIDRHSLFIRWIWCFEHRLAGCQGMFVHLNL